MKRTVSCPFAKSQTAGITAQKRMNSGRGSSAWFYLDTGCNKADFYKKQFASVHVCRLLFQILLCFGFKMGAAAMQKERVAKSKFCAILFTREAALRL